MVKQVGHPSSFGPVLCGCWVGLQLHVLWAAAAVGRAGPPELMAHLSVPVALISLVTDLRLRESSSLRLCARRQVAEDAWPGIPAHVECWQQALRWMLSRGSDLSACSSQALPRCGRLWMLSAAPWWRGWVPLQAEQGWARPGVSIPASSALGSALSPCLPSPGLPPCYRRLREAVRFLLERLWAWGGWRRGHWLHLRVQSAPNHLI